MAENFDPNSGGNVSHGAAPACSAEYSPASGGYEGDSIEGQGAPGVKEDAGGAEPGGNTTEGDYASTANRVGSYPHGQEDPECGGPPLGATVGPNGAVDSGTVSTASGIGPNRPGEAY